MKWRDHRRITLEVCKFYGLDNAKEIADASILPDKDPDYYWSYGRRRAYRRHVPHHDHMAIDMAFKYLKEARKNKLTGTSFAEPLGRALHYLQDYSVDPTEKLWVFNYRSDTAHETRESDLSLLPVDYQAMRAGASTRCYPHEFKDVVYGVGRGKTPRDIMQISTYLTSLAVKLVINPDKPDNLKGKYEKATMIHFIVIAIPWILTLLNTSNFLWSAIGSYILHKLDFNYSKWKTDYEWFEVGI
jgi:hypothetical protein